jgi:hypothetical protein
MQFAAVFAGLAGLAWAQTGSLTGNVTDPNGDGVPTAQIQARNTTTGVVYKAASAAKGSFTLGRLPAGKYDITVPPLGFTFPRYEQKDVAVAAGAPTRLDVHLAWGGNLGTPGDDFSLLVPGKGTATGPAPRGRDGKPDFSGVWIGNAPDVDTPDLLPWAAEITRQRRAKGTGNPGESCMPGDVFLVSPFIYKIIQTPLVMAILWEGNVPAVVQIFLDGRAHPNDAFPSWMGHSVGRWDRNALVVDTVGFNDLSWIRVFPHTEKLHVTQRYSRPNLGRLEKEVTIQDPDTFTKPWKMRTGWDLAPKEEVHEYICNENEKDVPHLK